jgi:hypothetical protein
MTDHGAEGHLARSQERLLLRAVAAAIKADFPNPERCGCPDAETVRSLAQRRIPLSQTGDLVDHIATCAPCFDAYSRVRRRRRIVRVIGPVVVGIICFTALALLSSPHRVPPTQPRQQLLANLPPVPVRPVTLDYRLTSPTRSPDLQVRAGKALRLPRGILDLTILLPVGTEDGEYSIELRTSGTQAVVHVSGPAKWDGHAVILATRVDIRQVAAGVYTLALRKDGASWRTYRVIVEELK